MDQREEFIFSDMGQAEPQSGISKKGGRFTWQAVDYTSSVVSGTMVLAQNDTDVPKLSFAPGLSGWYRINVGIYQGSVGGGTCITQVKLSDDRYPIGMEFGLSGEWEGKGPTVVEGFWKCADLTGQRVEIIHPSWLSTMSNVAYFRFLPMDAAAVAEELCSRSNPDHKRIYATHDIHWAHYTKNPKGADAIAEELEIFKDTDVERLFLEYMMDFKHPDAAQYFWDDPACEAYPRPGDRNVLESKRYLAAHGLDYYPAVVAYGQSLGMKVSLAFRMNAFAAQSPFDQVFGTRWFAENPQLHCVDIDGSEISKMSYAYPEVQDVVLGLFKRMLDTGADGIHMLFNRGLPCLLYEPPLTEAFRLATGKNAQSLPEEDAGYIAFRARYFADGFLRRVRRELTAYAAEKGYARPFISVHAHADARTNLFFGLDLDYLAKEGLIDAAIGYPTKMVNPNFFHYNRPQDIDGAYYGRLAADYGIHACYDIMPRRMEPEELKERAMEQYASGCDRVCMWDTYSRSWNARLWSMARRIGHRDALREMDCGEGTLYRQFILHTLGGLRVDKYNPFWGL